MKMKKKWWIIIAVVAVVACLGYLGFSVFQRTLPPAAADSVTETAVVERSTIRVSIDGSGSLAPADEVALAFPSGGEVAEVSVAVGDVVPGWTMPMHNSRSPMRSCRWRRPSSTWR
jgi:multidrug efflux pump subunit AcrA (membrane-fusion protein)